MIILNISSYIVSAVALMFIIYNLITTDKAETRYQCEKCYKTFRENEVSEIRYYEGMYPCCPHCNSISFVKV